MPDRRVPHYNRHVIATVLTIQTTIGALLGLVAQGMIVFVLIGHVMPWLGYTLLDLAEGVAALNIPMRLAQLF